MLKRSFSPCLSLGLLLLCPNAMGGTLYVDANLTTGLNDGTSWADAFQGPSGLKAALGAAASGDEIFVAQGSYRAAAGANRSRSFVLQSGIEIYGSFAGTESSPAERPPFGTADSILNGDLAGDDGAGQFGDNSFHLVKGGTSDSSAVLDGFVIQGGNANSTGNDDVGGGILCLNGCSPTIRNCRFVDNRCTFGGAAGYINGATPSFTDCSFEGGDGGSFGGAFDIATGGPVRFDRCVFKDNTAARAGALEIFATSGVVVSNCVFSGNTATGTGGGGGIWIGTGGGTTVHNCTIASNQATASAVGGMRVQSATVEVVNCILWGNTGQSGGHASGNQISSGVNVTYTIVEGGYSGTGNLSSDPLFQDPAGGDFSLTLASPAVDAGDNAGVPSDAPFDLSPSPRFVDEPSVADTGAGSAPIVDMGAFELSIGVTDLYCEPSPNSTGFSSVVAATGSVLLASNDAVLWVSSLPTNSFGYFLMSQSRASIPVASGFLCLGSPQLRFSKDVLSSGSTGAMTFPLDNTDLPQGQTFSSGESWYFQLWHRDGPTSNFSSSLGLTWL